MKNLKEIRKRIDELDIALRGEHKPETSVHLVLLEILSDLTRTVQGFMCEVNGMFSQREKTEPDETKEGLEAVGKEIDRRVSRQRQIAPERKDEMIVGGGREFPRYLVNEMFNKFVEHKKRYGNPGEALARTMENYEEHYLPDYVKEAIILGAFE